MTEKLKKLLKVEEDRKAEILKKSEVSNDIQEVRALSAEMDAVNGRIAEYKAMLAEAEKAQLPEPELDERTRAIKYGTVVHERSGIPEIVRAQASGQEGVDLRENEMENRICKLAEELRNGKDVTISSEVMKYLEKRVVATTNVLIETKYKRTIEENFNEVAQTVDLVDSFALDGGKEYQVAFQIDDGDADYTAESATYTNDEGTFGTATTGYAKITNSAIVNEEVVELPNADYLTRIVNSIRKSIRKKMSHQIIAGAGTINTLKGIYNAPTTTIPADYKVELSAIDADTLRTIVFAYGGVEDVESPATLILDKLDLASFAALKATDGRPVYSISYNGPGGYIEEVGGGLRVPYSINSACNALSDAGTAIGEKTMIYGDPRAYELPLFSNLVIKRSDERYIDTGQIGFFGRVFAGGVVNKYKGFLPIVKKA